LNIYLDIETVTADRFKYAEPAMREYKPFKPGKMILEDEHERRFKASIVELGVKYDIKRGSIPKEVAENPEYLKKLEALHIAKDEGIAKVKDARAKNAAENKKLHEAEILKAQQAYRDIGKKPAGSQVVCIGMAIDDDPVTSLCSPNELDVLHFFNDLVVQIDNQIDRPRIIAHNAPFDISRIWESAVYHQMHGLAEWLAFYKNATWEPEYVFCSMRQWLGRTLDKTISLNRILEFLGAADRIPKVSGADIYDMYEMEKYEEIQAYNESDVENLRWVCQRSWSQFRPKVTDIPW